MAYWRMIMRLLTGALDWVYNAPMATRGRPTEYKEEYVQKAIDYAQGAYLVRPTEDKITPFDDFTVLPTIEGLARYLGVARSTIFEWEKVHAIFSDAVNEMREKQAELLVNKSLIGIFQPKTSGILLSNHGYTEKTQSEITGAGGGALEIKTINVIGVDPDQS